MVSFVASASLSYALKQYSEREGGFDASEHTYTWLKIYSKFYIVSFLVVFTQFVTASAYHSTVTTLLTSKEKEVVVLVKL